MRRHQSPVRGFLRRLARDDSLADDLAQECFLQAWDKIHTYSGSGSFGGWLFRIAYNAFLQSKRKTKRYDEVLEQARHEAGPAAPAGVGEEAMDAERLLAALNEEERAIMIFSYACGLSHREISDATRLPVGTVKSMIHRAKQKIRTHFEIENHQHG